MYGVGACNSVSSYISVKSRMSECIIEACTYISVLCVCVCMHAHVCICVYMCDWIFEKESSICNYKCLKIQFEILSQEHIKIISQGSEYHKHFYRSHEVVGI